MMDDIRVRMAPSPTGYLHLGTARVALFNFLFAKKTGGAFVLRIEDTDIERSDPEFEKDILDGLQWLGIRWDEGPDVGGRYGPYRQSERLEIYRAYLEKLDEKKLLYECFCTKEELEKEREEQLWSKQPPKYSGKCRNLTKEQIDTFYKEGRVSTLRFKIAEKKISVTDIIRGTIEFDTSLIGDIIIAKNFNTPLYNFAVVIDDYEMNISHIIRGEDHVSNIPKQILLQQALDLPTPQFAHLPMILNSDRTKLSKRMNKVSLLDYRNEGYLPEAMVNFMALLGWNPGGDLEIFAMHDLVGMFNLDDVHRAAAIFNLQKLDWFNGYYIRKKNLDELVKLCAPYLRHNDGEKLKKMIALEQGRMRKLSEIEEKIAYVFADDLDYNPHLLCWKTMSPSDVLNQLQFILMVLDGIPSEHFIKNLLEKTIKDILQSSDRSNGEVLWPLRVALTGLSESPGPFDIADVLGKTETIHRVEKAIQKIKSLL